MSIAIPGEIATLPSTRFGYVAAALWACATVGCWLGQEPPLELVAAAGLTRLMSSLLFRVTALDPVTYTAVSALLIAAAVLARFVLWPALDLQLAPALLAEVLNEARDDLAVGRYATHPGSRSARPTPHCATSSISSIAEYWRVILAQAEAPATRSRRSSSDMWRALMDWLPDMQVGAFEIRDVMSLIVGSLGAFLAYLAIRVGKEQAAVSVMIS